MHILSSAFQPSERIPAEYGRSGRNINPPQPPSGVHRYFFKLFALDDTLQLEHGHDGEAVYEAMDGHVIDSAELMGTFAASDEA